MRHLLRSIAWIFAVGAGSVASFAAERTQQPVAQPASVPPAATAVASPCPRASPSPVAPAAPTTSRVRGTRDARAPKPSRSIARSGYGEAHYAAADLQREIARALAVSDCDDGVGDSGVRDAWRAIDERARQETTRQETTRDAAAQDEPSAPDTP